MIDLRAPVSPAQSFSAILAKMLRQTRSSVDPDCTEQSKKFLEMRQLSFSRRSAGFARQKEMQFDCEKKKIMKTFYRNRGIFIERNLLFR